MFKFIKKLFGSDAPAAPTAEAPYKIEPPVLEEKIEAVNRQPIKCGCGRSESGFCIGLHRLSDKEWAAHDANPNKTTSIPKRAKDSRGRFIADDPSTPENEAWVGGVAPARKKSAAKKPASKRPAAKKKASK